MIRLLLFFTPVIFTVGIICACSIEIDVVPLVRIEFMVASVAALGGWFWAAYRFEIAAWQAGRGGRPL